MAKTLIGNIKGKDGRGITSIKKTGTTGSVDTYTITYTDSTTSTFTINNSDSISLQRQIVPSAAIESSTMASKPYTSGDYVVVSGVLRKVTSAIARGNQITDSNSTSTTVTGEIGNISTRIGNISTRIGNIITGRVGPSSVNGGDFLKIVYDAGKTIGSSAVVIATCHSAKGIEICSFATVTKIEGSKVSFRVDNRGSQKDELYIDFAIFVK